MKVVIFCGGLGLRMGETSTRIPKPMITVGDRPILWHIMKYYASFGHSDFTLCLGYKGEVIERYFDKYLRSAENGGDGPPWSIAFADTGEEAVIGQRLKAVEPYIGGDEIFLATYGDGLTDAPLPKLIDRLVESGKVGVFLAAHPTAVFHIVTFDEAHVVRSLVDITKAGVWQNAGFFVFRREIFDYINEGEDLVDEPLHRLIAEEKLVAYPYEGFWEPMDTLKDKQKLDALAASPRPPWQVWENGDTESIRPIAAED
jgi:glucose-1-phosphate cytidylyltransferase